MLTVFKTPSLRQRQPVVRDLLHLFAAGLVFGGQAGGKFSIATPEAANWVLAVVAYLGVGMTT